MVIIFYDLEDSEISYDLCSDTFHHLNSLIKK